MNKNIWLISGMILGLSLQTATASELDLALSEKTASIEFRMDSEFIGTGGAEFSLAGLFNQDDDFAASIGLLMRGMAAGDMPYHFGLGGRLYLAHLDRPGEDVPALALGGEGAYIIPGNMPSALVGELYYAPSVTTFNDGEDLLDLRLRFELEVVPSAKAFIGYRNVAVGLKGRPSYDVDENIHGGIRIEF
ncbi:MAG: YfaZ family outer membrane protein [Thiotrichales bacterium]